METSNDKQDQNGPIKPNGGEAASSNNDEAKGSPPTPEFDVKYNHLYVDTALHIDDSIEDRVKFCYEDRFILHDSAKAALAAMKDIYKRPSGAVRPACLALIANSNEGKTAVARKFFKDLGGDPAQFFGHHDEMPVVLVEMPPRATEPRVCLAIARGLGLEGYNSKARHVTDNVYRALVAKKVRVLVLIEFQHVDPLPKCERSVVLDLVKGISNHGISVIAIGTEQAKLVIAEDEQVANRMRVVRLHGFRNNENFRNFLHTLEPYYPLPEASGLSSPALAAEIYSRTNGITGEVVALCNAAAVWAVQNKRPCIDKKAIQSALIYPAANKAA